MPKLIKFLQGVRLRGSILIVFLMGLASCRIAYSPDQFIAEISSPTGRENPSCGNPASHCTVFTLVKGGQVFFGGNDDYINPDSYYWVDPGQDGRYGIVWIGTPDNVQQGVNEAGLAYDANGLPRFDTNPHNERTPVFGGYTSYPIQIMRECGTVKEVIDWVKTHQWHSFMHDQLQFADAGGDAVIISAGPDGELVFTRKAAGDGFLVSTNFNVANPSNGFSYPCWRYDTAQGLLNQLSDQPGALSVQDAAGVLEAIHMEGGSSWTISSMLADLPNGKVYLYYFHQFDDPIVLDVSEQLANPPEPGPLSRLFPEKIREEAASRYERIQSQAVRSRWLGILWFMVIGASLVMFLLLSWGHGHRMIFWVPIVMVLGPLGILIWLITGRTKNTGTWRIALLETVGDVTPPALGFLSMLVLVLSIPSTLSSGLLQILLVLGLPLLMGLLLFNGPLLAPAGKRGYLQIISSRFPHVAIVSILALGGMSIIIIPLTNLALSRWISLPLPVSMAGILWAIVVLGAVPAGLFIWIYNFWMVRRNFRAWSCLVSDEDEFRTPGWRGLAWWIPLSFVALLGGMLIGILVNQFIQNML